MKIVEKQNVKEAEINSSDNEQLILAFCEMNIPALIDLLDEDIDYDDIGKYRFLEFVRAKFALFEIKGDTHLVKSSGSCQGCSNGSFGYRFIGNNSEKIWDVIFKVDGKKIIDIYECNFFEETKFDFLENQFGVA